ARLQGRSARDLEAARRGASRARPRVRSARIPRDRARRRRGHATRARRACARVDQGNAGTVMAEQRTLVRGLGFWGATSLGVGPLIGTGVFLKTAVMAQLGGSALWVLVAWIAAGVLSLAGAMTYAELGAMFPAAGGEYVYLRQGYGPFMGYLYAWNRF